MKKDIVNDYLGSLHNEAAVMMALSAASMLVSATKMYKEYFTKAARRCADLAPEDKRLCLIKSKIMAKNVQLQKVKSMIPNCNKTRNPDQCKEKMVKKLKLLSDDMQRMAFVVKNMQNRNQ